MLEPHIVAPVHAGEMHYGVTGCDKAFELASIAEYLARRRVKPVVPVEIVTHYVVSALLALLTWWLDDDLPYTAEQMAQMFEQLTAPALNAALGGR